jgi:hypothetical protein
MISIEPFHEHVLKNRAAIKAMLIVLKSIGIMAFFYKGKMSD